MRLWRLDELVENNPVIHICEKCGFRTLIPPILNVLNDKIPLHPPFAIEKNIGYCDLCNKEAWDRAEKKICEDIELFISIDDELENIK